MNDMKLTEDNLIKNGFKYPEDSNGNPNKDFLEFFMPEMNVWIRLERGEFENGIYTIDLLNKIDRECKEALDNAVNQVASGLDI